MENIFTTKEQFITYRNFWKQFHKNKKHKGIPVPFTKYNYTTGKSEVVGYHSVSPLSSIYHLFNCVIMGKNPDKGFKNMHSWNAYNLFYDIKFNTDSIERKEKLFKLYEGSLPEEFYDTIINRAKEYLENKGDIK